jgi:hypothetical protein
MKISFPNVKMLPNTWSLSILFTENGKLSYKYIFLFTGTDKGDEVQQTSHFTPVIQFYFQIQGRGRYILYSLTPYVAMHFICLIQ